tara:strand:+ start:1123 stop:1587 length:465 start_codon:yes stop_codon:yes gene_type:complete
MTKWKYTKGLHDLGNGSWAYLLPDGGWGWSNAGLIAESGETLLVDTLFDLPLTADMLDTMRDAVPAAKEIDTLVNTHANGDHTYGNQLVDGAEIVAPLIVPLRWKYVRRKLSSATSTHGRTWARRAQSSGSLWAASSISPASKTASLRGPSTAS